MTTLNILFFLIPKSQVEYVFDDYSVRQVLEKMSFHRYSAVPVLNHDGNYVGTVTEGDLLWHIKDQKDYNVKKAENDPLSSVEKKHTMTAIKSTEKIEDLLQLAINQNFVPVLDDNNIFIGIITRKDIIQYCRQELYSKE